MHSLYICVVLSLCIIRISNCESSFFRYVVVKSSATRFFGLMSLAPSDLLSASGISMSQPGVTLATLVNSACVSLGIHILGVELSATSFLDVCTVCPF